MILFRRVLARLFLAAGFLSGLVTALALLLTRHMVRPPRQRLWATPGDLNIPFEDVQFPARDGVRLAGWFIPVRPEPGAERPPATVLIVHAWTWNRLGQTAADLISNLNGSREVDLLRLAYHLHQAGYQSLCFDLRNHGQSAPAPPVSFGPAEAEDVLGALAFLDSRSDVDPERIFVLAFAMGANATLYAFPHTRLRAAVLVQPTTMSIFARRLGADMFGPLSRPILLLAHLLYRAAGGRPWREVVPGQIAQQSGGTPILYIQGKGDRWGSIVDVAEMAAASPQARGPLFVASEHRTGAYRYLVDNPRIITAFFEQHLTVDEPSQAGAPGQPPSRDNS